MEAAQAATQDIPNKPRPGLVVVILPQSAGPLRKAVKQWGDLMQGIPTQCVVSPGTQLRRRRPHFCYQRAGKYESANDQYCNNVALKLGRARSRWTLH